MKTLLIRRYASPLALALLVFLVGCIVPSVPASPTGVGISPTLTSSPTAVPSLTPSFESPTDTPTSSPIPPTRTPRPTPAPTLSADEEQAIVLNLLQNNAGCRLPCWWGFMPGETSWEMAQTYFLSIGKAIGEYRDGQSLNCEVDFAISQHKVTIDQLYVVNENKIIDMINVVASGYGQEVVNAWQRYMLPHFLAAYGQPSQVLLKTFSGVSGVPKVPPFHLLLYYPQQGIMVRYIDDAEKMEGTLRLCPQQSPGVTLWLWSPEQHMTLQDIADTGLGGFPDNELPSFQSVEEATGISVEQFYQTFVQPDNQTCLETPVDLW